MSERISEGTLRVLDSDAAQAYDAPAQGLDLQAGRVRILVAEVRRLRRLIVGAADTSWDECPIDGPAEDGAYLQCAKTDCAWPAFRAEARAICEEQGRG